MTLFNFILSISMSFFQLGSFELETALDNYGNFTLIEAMLLFLYGSAIDISHSAKWHMAMKTLKIRPHVYQAIQDEKDWNIQESKKAERKASIFIITGGFLLLEIIILLLFR